MLKYAFDYQGIRHTGIIENDQLNTGDFAPQAIIAAEERDGFFRITADGVHLQKIRDSFGLAQSPYRAVGGSWMFNSEDSRTIVMNWKNVVH